MSDAVTKYVEDYEKRDPYEPLSYIRALARHPELAESMAGQFAFLMEVWGPASLSHAYPISTIITQRADWLDQIGQPSSTLRLVASGIKNIEQYLEEQRILDKMDGETEATND